MQLQRAQDRLRRLGGGGDRVRHHHGGNAAPPAFGLEMAIVAGQLEAFNAPVALTGLRDELELAELMVLESKSVGDDVNRRPRIDSRRSRCGLGGRRYRRLSGRRGDQPLKAGDNAPVGPAGLCDSDMAPCHSWIDAIGILPIRGNVALPVGGLEFDRPLSSRHSLRSGGRF